MSLEYDEIRITTRREITICEAKIRELERVLAAMETKYRIASAVFLESYNPHAVQNDREMTRWHQSCHALISWKERLAEHWRIMEM